MVREAGLEPAIRFNQLKCSSSCFISFWDTKYNTLTYEFSNRDFSQNFTVSLPLILNTHLRLLSLRLVMVFYPLPFLSSYFAWAMSDCGRTLQSYSVTLGGFLSLTLLVSSQQDCNASGSACVFCLLPGGDVVNLPLSTSCDALSNGHTRPVNFIKLAV